MSTAQLLPREEPEQQTQALVPKTPMEMLGIAVQQGAAIDTIERLVALQERMLARDAELAFNAAMNRAQTELGPVAADLTNPQTKSKYASYPAIDRKVRPVYSKHGLALSFDTADSQLPEHIRVVCYVSHADGHTRSYHVDMPADGKGAKGGDVMTKTHAAGSAMSYGMRYLVKMIFNIAVGEDDNDGNGTGAGLTEQAVEEYLTTMRDSMSRDELQKTFAAAYKAANTAKDKRAMATFIQFKDKRKGELQ